MTSTFCPFAHPLSIYDYRHWGERPGRREGGDRTCGVVTRSSARVGCEVTNPQTGIPPYEGYRSSTRFVGGEHANRASRRGKRAVLPPETSQHHIVRDKHVRTWTRNARAGGKGCVSRLQRKASLDRLWNEKRRALQTLPSSEILADRRWENDECMQGMDNKTDILPPPPNPML